MPYSLRVMESKIVGKIPHLPQEIIVDILLRIPIKFLLRFRSTSKLWCSLISSKHFINAHLRNSTKNPTSAHHRILLVTKKSNYELQHCSMRSLSLKQVTDAKSGKFPIDKSVQSLKLVGSCNGLICILINKKDFFLWNPATTKFKKLPDLDVYNYDTEHGFGFDESSGDYKIYAALQICRVFNGCNAYPSRCLTTGNIYSLKTDSWTRINNTEDGPILSSNTGIFVSGKLHWIRAKEEPNRRWYISSLDLKNEVYGIVEKPSVMDDYDNMTFDVFDGCLSMIYYYRDNEHIDFWVLRHYSDKDSWSKLMTLSDNQDRIDFSISQSYVIPLNEEVLFKFETGIGIAAHNPKDNRSWDLTLVALDEFLDSNIYVESLVSINYE